MKKNNDFYQCNMKYGKSGEINAVFLAESVADVRAFVHGKGAEASEIKLCHSELGDVLYDVTEFKKQAYELQDCLNNPNRREEVATKALRMILSYSPAMAGSGLGAYRSKVMSMQNNNPAFAKMLEKVRKADGTNIIDAACEVSSFVRNSLGIFC